MSEKKKILAISGSTRKDSNNLQILNVIGKLLESEFDYQIFHGLADLPHFNPDIDNETPPKEIVDFRKLVEDSVGIIICTPEYVFSIPGALKNAIEWMVSTTIFSDKPTVLITASGLGEKAHESLLLIMKTLGADTPEKSQLLIKGVRSKIKDEQFSDPDTFERVKLLVNSLKESINKKA